MEEHQELEKPICRFCNKRFTSARILQNHMKTHFTPGASDGVNPLNQRDLSCYYGLRENLKKTQKFSGLNSPEGSLDRSGTRKSLIRCKECGKGFRYEKCLSNHHAGMHSGKQRASEESRASLCDFSHVRRKRSRVTRYKKTRLSLFSTFPESLSGSATEEELEVVECLILLSKSGVEFLDGLKLVSEALESNSETFGIQDSWVCLSNKKLRTGGESDQGVSNIQQKQDQGVSVDETTPKELQSCLGGKNTSKGNELVFQGSLDNHQKKLGEVELKRMCLDDEPIKRFHGGEIDIQRRPHCEESEVSRKRASSPCSGNNVNVTKPVFASDLDTETLSETQRNVEHRCRTCNKIFSSYQALGGHQTLHRMRNKTVCEPKTERQRETVELKAVTVSGYAEHKCSICSRVFRSVHALGGHKKCHHLRRSSRATEEACFDPHSDIDLNVPVTGAIEQA